MGVKVWVVWYEFDEFDGCNCSKCVEIKDMNWEQLKKRLLNSGWRLKIEKTMDGEEYEDLVWDDMSSMFRVSLADEYDRAEVVVEGWDGFKRWFGEWAWNVFDK